MDATPTLALPMPLVSCEWLRDHLAKPSLRIVDASYFLPSAQRDAKAEYAAGHIAGAVFADLDALSDATAPYPHTMPSAERLAPALGRLGIARNHAVVVYDTSGQFFSAPRVWWMLRSIGHSAVSVLDGGLARWRALGFPLSQQASAVAPTTYLPAQDAVGFRALADVRAAVDDHVTQIVDARSAGRFHATEPEPRPGVRGGHIPGARHVHYASLVTPSHTLKPAPELATLFTHAGVDVTRPVIASCGSGVTACAVALALTVLGATDVTVYDGSWTEWGSQPDTPVER
ncbi:MAG: 3-mercaptopyruvate sulfurtransferase [Gemmatimonadaceae bacterium]|nr:3-mercaptopyruvate sulfurtransferase [Gemmatimonadaceae bacterium]